MEGVLLYVANDFRTIKFDEYLLVDRMNLMIQFEREPINGIYRIYVFDWMREEREAFHQFIRYIAPDAVRVKSSHPFYGLVYHAKTVDFERLLRYDNSIGFFE